jgi:cell division septation protein DedD
MRAVWFTLGVAIATGPGAAAADFASAVAAYDAGDFAVAAAAFEPLAEAGDAAAAHNLGLIHGRGEIGAVDLKAAVHWLRIAAEHGEPTSQNLLGTMYYKGQGVPIDKPQAAAWIKRAAEQGHAAAQANLSQMYLYGDGVTQDYAEAEEWARRAKAQPSGQQANEGDILREPFSGDAERVATAPGATTTSGAPQRLHTVPALAAVAPAAAAPAPAPQAAPPTVARGVAAAAADLPWLHQVASAPPAEPAPPTRAVALAMPEPPAGAGFAVQLAAAHTAADAEGFWTDVKRRHADLLGEYGHWVERADLGGDSVFRLRVGPFESRDAARRVCGDLAARRLDCWVAAR